MEEFAPYFAEVPDPRAANARHDFLEVVFTALAAVLCGAEDCTDMALFARSKLDQGTTFILRISRLDSAKPVANEKVTENPRVVVAARPVAVAAGGGGRG